MPALTTPTTLPQPSTSSYDLEIAALPSNLGAALSELPNLLPTTKPTTTATATASIGEDDELLARQQTIPAYTPIVTPAPDQDEQLASLGYYQQTYYTCNTIGGNEHCGWHIPVVKAAAGRVGGRVGAVLGVAAGAAGWAVL
ncbi:Fc.00g031380.m01.CDS01 [Cosmosporella sp. VM-42]